MIGLFEILTISVSSKPNLASPNPTIKLSFILSNSGGSNGNIEYTSIKLKHISKEEKVLEEQDFKSYWGPNRIKLPILIEKGRAESIPNLEYVTNNGFRFNIGTYIIELYILFAGNTKLPKKILTTPKFEIDDKSLHKLSKINFVLIDPIDKKYSVYISKAEKS